MSLSLTNSIKKAIGQLVIGFLFTILTFPILLGTVNVVSSDISVDEADVASVFWYERLPDVYFHVLFLGCSVIASMLVIRKPPRLLKEIITRGSVEGLELEEEEEL